MRSIPRAAWILLPSYAVPDSTSDPWRLAIVFSAVTFVALLALGTSAWLVNRATEGRQAPLQVVEECNRDAAAAHRACLARNGFDFD